MAESLESGEYKFFEWSGEAEEVLISASFTNWKPEPLAVTRSSSSKGKYFVNSYQLPVGIHSYLFLVDGEPQNDPRNELALNTDNYNQVAVLPTLPDYLPHTITGLPFAHLFLKFHPSIMNYVYDFIHGNGYEKNLISIKILDQKLVHACALLLPEDVQDDWATFMELSDKPVHNDYRLQILPFKKFPRDVDAAGAKSEECAYRVLVGPRFPKYVIKQHIEEHFSILRSKILKIEHCQSQEHSFVLIFESLLCANEAMATFHNSLLKGIQITVSLDGKAPSIAANLQNRPAFTMCSDHDTPNKNVFVYSKPKFPNFVTNEDLMEHFRDFHPKYAFIIKKKTRSTGVGKVMFPSESVAEEAIRRMDNTKVLGAYPISLKFENPDFPPRERKQAPQPSGNGGVVPVSQHSPPVSHQYCVETPVIIGSSIKVSHLPDSVTVKKLINRFKVYGDLAGDPVLHLGNRHPYAHINFKSKSAAQKALALDRARFEGSVIAVKTTEPPKSSKLKVLEPVNVESEKPFSRVMKLLIDDWDKLQTAEDPTGLTLLDELKTPYLDNPNITIEQLFREKSLKFTGKRETVNSCYAYFAKHIKRELGIDRAKMNALVSLKPSLSSELEHKYPVHVTGYCKGSTKIRLDGQPTDIEASYDEIKFLLSTLREEMVSLEEDFPIEKFESMQKELEADEVYLHLPESESRDKKSVLLYYFSHPDITKFILHLKSLVLSETTIPCRPEEVVFLQFNTKITTLPLNFGEGSVILKGTHSAVQLAESEVKMALEGLHSHKVCLTCNPCFKDHIQHCMLPFEKQDHSFSYFISNVDIPEAQSTQQPKDNSSFHLYIFSKNSDIYSKAHKFVTQLNPGTKKYKLPENAEDVVKEVQENLQEKFYVRISYVRSTLTVHGLMVDNLDQCYAELKDRIESTILSTKLISISGHQKLLFRNLYTHDLDNLKKHCSSVSLTGKANCIEVKGTMKQVQEVERKLKIGLLSMKILYERFSMHCDSKLAKMWQRRWEQVKEKEKKRCRIIITYTESVVRPNTTAFAFEVVGTDKFRVKEVKDAFLAEEPKVHSIPLGQTALRMVDQELKQGNLTFLSDLTVHVAAHEMTKAVVITAPKDCASDLDSAVEKINLFVRDHVDTTDDISTTDLVVKLVLESRSLFAPYLTRANREAKRHELTISLVKKPFTRLQIKGSKSQIETAKPIIEELTVTAIEKSIAHKQIELKSIYNPILTKPYFSQLKSKLQDGFCTTCALSSTKNSNEVKFTSHLPLQGQDETIRIDVVKGDITLERVDAIVNAANEELQHHGGLAKAIVDAGGPEIQYECDTYRKMHLSKLDPGDVLCLSSGHLPCNHVFHAVGPRWANGKNKEGDVLQSAVYNSLKAAHMKSLAAIAIPAISIGIFGVPAQVCAKASAKAVEEFARECPGTSLRNIKFVMLSQVALDAFFPLITSDPFINSSAEVSEDVTPSTPPTASQAPPSTVVSFQWKWRNDHKSFTPYTDDLNSKINSRYQDDPLASCVIMVNSAPYTINFRSMEQRNVLTGFKRAIVKEEIVRPAPAVPRVSKARSGVEWQYTDDQGKFVAYTSRDSEAIEEMYVSKRSRCLKIGGNVYTFNFTRMCQINCSTNHERKIKRDEAGPTSKTTTNTSYTVSLRGPEENLSAAERTLKKSLEKLLKKDVIKPLPDTMTDELSSALSQIATKNDVNYSFERESDLEPVMTLEGIGSGVERAVSEIYKHLLNFKAAQDKEVLIAAQATDPKEPQSYPPEWDPQPKHKKHYVVQVQRGTAEWEHVRGKFESTMSTHVVVKIERIQKPHLWERYQLTKKQIEQKNGGDANEMELFHGSSSNNPQDIIEDEDGFDMRCSSGGMWGAANYFAVNASYSHRYSHSVPTAYSSYSSYSLRNQLSMCSMYSHREQQMFLAKVLVGESYETAGSSSALKKPPFKPGTKEKYDSVSGYTRGSKVYMTYDNSRAYPAYLITYK